MHLSKTAWIVISGVIWLIVGIGLLTLGLNLIIFKAQLDPTDTLSLIAKLAPLTGGREQAALVIVAAGLILGFIKGRYVLGKTVKRVAERIFSLSYPIRFSQVYHKSYLLLIGCMIFLGLLMKWTGLPLEIRGTVDVAIGSALMNGAMAYFRIALAVNKQRSE
jgi:hypothetical protein